MTKRGNWWALEFFKLRQCDSVDIASVNHAITMGIKNYMKGQKKSSAHLSCIACTLWADQCEKRPRLTQEAPVRARGHSIPQGLIMINLYPFVRHFGEIRVHTR